MDSYFFKPIVKEVNTMSKIYSGVWQGNIEKDTDILPLIIAQINDERAQNDLKPIDWITRIKINLLGADIYSNTDTDEVNTSITDIVKEQLGFKYNFEQTAYAYAANYSEPFDSIEIVDKAMNHNIVKLVSTHSIDNVTIYYNYIDFNA